MLYIDRINHIENMLNTNTAKDIFRSLLVKINLIDDRQLKLFFYEETRKCYDKGEERSFTVRPRRNFLFSTTNGSQVSIFKFIIMQNCHVITVR